MICQGNDQRLIWQSRVFMPSGSKEGNQENSLNELEERL